MAIPFDAINTSLQILKHLVRQFAQVLPFVFHLLPSDFQRFRKANYAWYVECARSNASLVSTPVDHRIRTYTWPSTADV